MRSSKLKYLPVAQEDGEVQPERALALQRKYNYALAACVLQSILLLLCVGIFLVNRKECSYGHRLLYSPAYEALESEIKVFTVGKPSWGGYTRWQGYTNEVDDAWKELYNKSLQVNRIPKSQASLLPNRTYPIAGDPEGYYVMGLDVFHQLHCLNIVRMAFRKERYLDYATELSQDHVWHCVDAIRQSLMCNADISVNVWQWDDRHNKVMGRSTQAHQCHNFDKIRNWALEHTLPKMIDLSVKLPEDDLVWKHGNY